ncbi:hypothetical protein RsTz2092_10130 [Deferribacterales bacterium RsTz2092]|nr:hypothetical protein AGMMS49941_07780 [Deferribacterales bacterium]
MNITLRTILKDSDPVAIREIASDTAFFSEAEIATAGELAVETLAKPDEYLFIFAELDGRVVGYVCYGEIPLTSGSYDLYWIVVKLSLQGAGIGQMLLAAVEQEVRARNGRQIFISTSSREQYAHTRAFYEHAGYSLNAQLTDFYTIGEDECIYRKNVL